MSNQPDLLPVKHPSKNVSFDNLTIEFIVDENLENWRELYDWMRTIYLVNDYKNFEDLIFQLILQRVHFFY